MTLPASGAIVLGLTGGGNSINGEFGYGNNLQSYLGVYYGKAGQAFQFPTPGNSIGVNLFYSTYKITGGTQTFTSSSSFVIPVYNTITITAVGGAGGQGGAAGYNGCVGQFTNGFSGAAGGVSSFFTVAAAGGAGGAGNSGAGGAGQTITQTFTNPVQGGTGPVSGSTASAIVGAGGGGGQGGPNSSIINPYGCLYIGNAATGSNGAAGSITITWS